MPGTPLDPIGIYALDWENPADQNIPPNAPVANPPHTSAPPGWSSREYVFRGNVSQVNLVHDPNPVRAGRSAVRFELRKGDPEPPSRGARAELSAAEKSGNPVPYEPIGADRWYGFSIYLPDTWAPDPNPEIVTQWHHDYHAPDQGSPPLAIMTGKDPDNANDAQIYWLVSMRDWRGSNTKSVKIAPCAPDFNRWADWGVHVKWSAVAHDPNAVAKVWKDGIEVFNWDNTLPIFQQTGEQNSYIDTAVTPNVAYGNYIKIGIYKWCWRLPAPAICNATQLSDPTARIMYHDELRIADGALFATERDGYNAVAPATPLYRYWSPGGSDHFYSTDFTELGRSNFGWSLEHIQCRILPPLPPLPNVAPRAGSIPLYRYWNAGNSDHFYTTDRTELGDRAFGWNFEKIEGYVYAEQLPGTVPLYRYWNAGSSDHFYTTDRTELGDRAFGWVLERIQCYVFPAS